MRSGYINLLEETREKLKEFGKTESDVKWVGVNKIYFKWEHFRGAADFEYDPGFGAREIAASLIIVGEDWWLSRGEYDGSEWWDFNTQPILEDREYIIPDQHFLRDV